MIFAFNFFKISLIPWQEAEDLGACVELVGEEVEMEEEDDEDGTGAAVSHEALSVRLGTAGTAGMAALAAIHSSTSGSSAKCPPNDREMSPSSEVCFQI